MSAARIKKIWLTQTMDKDSPAMGPQVLYYCCYSVSYPTMESLDMCNAVYVTDRKTHPSTQGIDFN